MSEFVQQCRREWARLGVADSVANEMAADLAADLQEAEAEGVSAEEVLGSSAFDPRAFAAAWAAERGVIPPASARESAPRKPLVPAALTALAVIALVGAALLALAPHSRAVAMAPTAGHARLQAPPAPPSGPFVLHGAPVAAELLAWVMLLFVVTLGIVVSAWLWSRWHGSRPPTALA